MARIRSIKPEFPQSESMGRVSRDARLTFVMLWTISDDGGRLRGNSRMLASLLFPYDEDAGQKIDGWLLELENEGCITRYNSAGSSYVAIKNWSSHQKIDKPTPSKLPAPPEHVDAVPVLKDLPKSDVETIDFTGFDDDSRTLANPREDSERTHHRKGVEGKGVEGSAEGTTDVAPGAADAAPEKPDEPKKGKRGSEFVTVDRPEDVSEQVWEDFVKHRRAKKATVSATVISRIRTQADKAGVTLEEAFAESIGQGWGGFKAAWVLKDGKAAQPKRDIYAGAI